MEYRQIITQNKLSLVDYYNVQAIYTARIRTENIRIYAHLKTDKRILLGTYQTKNDAVKIIDMINKWLQAKYLSMNTYDCFNMPPSNFIELDEYNPKPKIEPVIEDNIELLKHSYSHYERKRTIK